MQTIFQQNNGYTGDITLAYIPNNFKIDVLGASLDNGILVHKSTDQLSNFALLFETKGTLHTKYVFYNCYVQPTDINYNTNADKVAHQDEKLSIVASPIQSFDEKLNNRIFAEIDKQENADMYNTWFDILPKKIRGDNT